MSSDPNDQQQAAAAASAATAAAAPASSVGGSAEPPKRIPKGVVLGPDGKPCRSCTSFAAWASQTKGTIKQDAAVKAQPTATASLGPPSECPPDVEVLGRSTWTLLHSIAAQYPEQPSTGQKSDLVSFVGLFSKLYPCWVCAEDFQGYLKREAPQVNSRDEFGKWLCGAHNDVNRKLGKPEFDCSRWQERWRTGWKDGRCD